MADAAPAIPAANAAPWDPAFLPVEDPKCFGNLYLQQPGSLELVVGSSQETDFVWKWLWGFAFWCS